MSAVLVGTHPGRVAKGRAKEIEGEGETGMATNEVAAMVELLIESGRALVPTPDPDRVERVWRRVMAALHQTAR